MTKTSSNSNKSTPRPLSRSTKIINPNRIIDKKQTHMRTKGTINRLNMYKSRAVHDKHGNFLRGDYMSRTPEVNIARIAPNRKWFGNTRVIDQNKLTQFRNDMNVIDKDKYQVVMKAQTLPLSLLNNTNKSVSKINILQNIHYNNIIGKGGKIMNKKPKITTTDYDILINHNNNAVEQYNSNNDKQTRDALLDSIINKYSDSNNNEKKLLSKGQSRRIWSELYKVIDSSDVIIHVLDARNPLQTQCRRIINELNTPQRKHKQLIYILNKCDLIPTYITRQWIKYFSAQAPTLAFHSSITNSFGKGTLINLLRQFGQLHNDKQQISVGFVGYPNVGKSSIINTLCGKQVCKSAPVPGQTRVWQYITLFKKILLIDSPGVVYHSKNDTANANVNDDSVIDDNSVEVVLQGCVRVEALTDPQQYIQYVLKRVRPHYIATAYGIKSYKTVYDFLTQLAQLTGKLRRGGEPDITLVAKMVLNDFVRGKLPYYMLPPDVKDIDSNDNQQHELQVQQLYHKIHVKHKFDHNDNDNDNDIIDNNNDNNDIHDYDEEYDNVNAQVEEIQQDSDNDNDNDNDQQDQDSSDESNDSDHDIHDDNEQVDNDIEQSDSNSIDDEQQQQLSDDDEQDDSQSNSDNNDHDDDDDSNNNQHKPQSTNKKRKYHRKKVTKSQSSDDDDIATTFLADPVRLNTTLAGNEKISKKSLNKKKKKRQLAKRKRMRVCQ